MEENKLSNQMTRIPTLPKAISPRGRGKQMQQSDKINEGNDDSSDEDTSSQQSGNRSQSSASDSLLNVSARSDLSRHSDANVNSHSETHKRCPRLNTPTSSDNDVPDAARGISTFRSPSKLCPDLKELSSHGLILGTRYESKDNTEHKPSKDHAKKHPEPYNTTILLVVIGLILAVILIFFYYVKNSPKPLDNSTVTPFDMFVGHVKDLEQVLPSQNKRLWRTVKASAMHVLQDTNSKYPAVILMAAMPDRTHVSRCIANKIASSFDLTHGMNPQIADIRDLQNFDPAWQKEKLDEKLNSAFSSNQRKSFIIDNLQLLHPEAALLLHGYCDGDNAPHKDVMMVLLLHIDEKDVTSYDNAAIENYLEQLWSRSLELDKVKALLSRVANNVVTIESEHDEDFKKACQ